VEGGDKQRLPITPSPADVGRSLPIAQSDGPQGLTRRVNDPHPTRACAVEGAIQVDFHAIGHTGPLVLQDAKQVSVCHSPVVQDIEGIDQPYP
jgi:hypothetical protein